jgi:hypothetical protein
MTEKETAGLPGSTGPKSPEEGAPVAAWLPVVNAPQDGRRLLLLYVDSPWGVMCGEWTIDARGRGFWTNDYRGTVGIKTIRRHQPAYWMPLPEGGGVMESSTQVPYASAKTGYPSAKTGFIARELDRISEAMRQTPEKYEQLYVAQQALSWAIDPANFAAPLDVIQNGLVQPLTS